MALCSLSTLAGCLLRDSSTTRPAALDLQEQEDGAFGFHLGEERRYVLGPDDVLPDGVFARWSIRLDSVESTLHGERAVFALEHDRFQYRPGLLRFPRVVVESRSEMTVTETGFPVLLRTSETERTSDGNAWVGRAVREIRYSSEQFDIEYVIHGQTKASPREGSLVVRVPSERYEGPTFRRGLYLFNSSELTCLGMSRVPLTLPCRIRVQDGDPAFANPGLLGLLFATMSDGRGNDEQLIYRLDARLRTWGGSHPRGRRPFVDLSVRGGETVRLPLGSRTVTAVRYELSTTGQAVFIDPRSAEVLLLEVARDPRTREERHIRLLFPSEY